MSWNYDGPGNMQMKKPGGEGKKHQKGDSLLLIIFIIVIGWYFTSSGENNTSKEEVKSPGKIEQYVSDFTQYVSGEKQQINGTTAATQSIDYSGGDPIENLNSYYTDLNLSR